jgi:hypothetical protein
LNGKRNSKPDSQQLEPTETELRKGADDLLPAVGLQRGWCRKVKRGQVGVRFEPKNLLLLWSCDKPEIGVSFLVFATAPSFGTLVCGCSVACGPELAVVTPLPGLSVVPHAVRTVSGSDATPADGPRSAISRSLSAFGARGEAARRAPSGSLMGSATATADVASATLSAAATAVVPSSALSTMALGTFSARFRAIS